MIRKVNLNDAAAIAAIYNEYVEKTNITFEVEPLTADEMRGRIAAIADRFPYFVYETDGEVAGYCYAHAWKQRAAYRHTLETTVYLAATHTGKGIGRQLMQALIEACRATDCHALVACITEGNAPSVTLHKRLGFRQVSEFKQVGQKFGQWLDVSDYELPLND